MVNAGRVAIVPKGEWNATTQYGRLDFITYDNKAYIGKVDNIPLGTLPTDSNYFQLCLDIVGFASTSYVDAELNNLKNDAEFVNSISMGRLAGSTIGEGSVALGGRVSAEGRESHAEGQNTKAIGDHSHAEGYGCVANGAYSHAEGIGTKTDSKADRSHAEGRETQTYGSGSHAEGYKTIAKGAFSHTIGIGTVTGTNNEGQFALGKYNVEDNDNNYAVVVGNGSDESNRSNALAITWGGEIVRFFNQKEVKVLKMSGSFSPDEADILINKAKTLQTKTFTEDIQILGIKNILFTSSNMVGMTTRNQYYNAYDGVTLFAETSNTFGQNNTSVSLIVRVSNDVALPINGISVECEIEYIEY